MGWGALALGKDIAEVVIFYVKAAKKLAKYVNLRAEGPYHSRCVRETYHPVLEGRDISFETCADTGRLNLYILREDLKERAFTS